MSKNVIIIPARYQSTRLPGKPLVPIAGVAMIERVWKLAKQVQNIFDVYVATDDERIISFVHAFGGKTIVTDENCPNGTARCFDAVRKLDFKPDVIFNMQGDAPITPPWIVQEIVDQMSAHPSWEMATPAVNLSWDARAKLIENKIKTPSSGTTVVFDRYSRALYFSKNVLPFVRSPKTGNDASPTWRHIGLYAYRYDALKKYLDLPEAEMEDAEKLEQLRALYHDIAMYVVPVDYQGRTHGSVDSPEDVTRLEVLIEKEGELIER